MALSVSAATADATHAHGTATPAALVLGAAVGVGDLVMFFVANNKNGSYQSLSTVTSSPALTWTRQWIFENDQVTGGTAKCNMELWTAKNTGSAIGASGLTITPTFGSSTDAITYSAWVVSGQDASSPRDPNGSLPNSSAVNTSSTGTHVSSSGNSTTNTDTIIFGFFGNSASGFPSANTGWTGLVGYDNAFGSNFGSMFVEYKIFSTAQSGITVDTTGSNQGVWQFVVDAIQAAAATDSGTMAAVEATDVAAFAGSNGAAVTGTFAAIEATDIANFTGPPLSGTITAIEATDHAHISGLITHPKRRVLIIT